MCEDMKALFRNMKPYIEKCPVLDIVETKFGLIMLENVGRRELWIEHTMIESYDDLLWVLFRNVEADILESQKINSLTEKAVPEFRYRIGPMLAGLPDEAYAYEQMAVFIAEHIE